MPEPGSPPTLKCFFDRVVRWSFGDLALSDDPAADYLSDLMTRFAHTENLYPTSHIGDYTLFMTGLFHERVEHLSVTGYYIREGKRSYHFVFEHDRADARPQARLFRVLADRFEGYAGVLNYMRKVYFRPEHDLPDLPFFRRLITAW